MNGFNNPSRLGLPPGWLEYKDPRSQRSYFYNEKTGVTQWQRPDIVDGQTPRALRQSRYSDSSILIPDIGVHLVQDTISSKLVVSHLVPGGSADRFESFLTCFKQILMSRSICRSGIIRIHDAIVKIDDEDIQGQPMPVISGLIAGKQGTFVVIAFRRMTGKEIFYYDVELERGSSEYFSSMDRSDQNTIADPNNVDHLRAWAAEYKNISRDMA